MEKEWEKVQMKIKTSSLFFTFLPSADQVVLSLCNIAGASRLPFELGNTETVPVAEVGIILCMEIQKESQYD